jgi:hypothetical protein
MKTYGGTEVWFHSFLTSALEGCERSASRPSLSWYTVKRRLGRPHSQSEDTGEKKNLLLLLGIKAMIPWLFTP